MNRNEARRIAEIITDAQIEQMFFNAEHGIRDWEKVSAVNKGLTKGVSWNIFSKIPIPELRNLGKINAIHEFGDWLPVELQPVRVKKEKQKPTHQEPIFKTE